MRHLIAGLALLALAACSTIPITTPAQGLYAALGSYDAAVKSAADYAEQPIASPTIVHKIKLAKDQPDVRTAVDYGRAYAACKATAVGTATTSTGTIVDCSLFDFTSNTALGYAATLNAVVTVLIQATGGVQ